MRLNILILLILIFGIIMVGCSQQQKAEEGKEETSAPSETLIPTTTGTEDDDVKGESTAITEVFIEGFAFKPNSITIPIGTTIKWTNEDDTTHTVTSEDGIFDSGDIKNGETYSYTFNEAGSFKYYCTIHPSMRAIVVVE